MAARKRTAGKPAAGKSTAGKSTAGKSAAGKRPSGEVSAIGRPCPICGKPPSVEYTPFCSKRCADVDLHRWLGGVYAVPTEEQPGDGEMPPVDRDEH